MKQRQAGGANGDAPDRRTVILSGLFATAASTMPAAAAVAPPVANGGATGTRTASATEGPYYRRLDLVRSDIAEGLSGVPLDLRFTIVDDAGRACAGLRVDVWHCDAQGRYSGFAEPGAPSSEALAKQTFLRGTQVVGDDGAAAFRTIYPGWYRGRTTHIHFKVLNAKGTVLTSQFFLPDTLSEFLYVSVPDYRRAAVRDTLNSTDGIAIEAGDTVHGSVREAGDRYVATLTIRVDPTRLEPAGVMGPPGSGPGPRPGGGPPPFGAGPPGFGPPGFGPPPGGPFGPPGGPFGPPPGRAAPTGAARIAALLPDAPRDRSHGPEHG